MAALPARSPFCLRQQRQDYVDSIIQKSKSHAPFPCHFWDRLGPVLARSFPYKLNDQPDDSQNDTFQLWILTHPTPEARIRARDKFCDLQTDLEIHPDLIVAVEGAILDPAAEQLQSHVFLDIGCRRRPNCGFTRTLTKLQTISGSLDWQTCGNISAGRHRFLCREHGTAFGLQTPLFSAATNRIPAQRRAFD